MKINDKICGFLLKDCKKITDIGSTMYLFEHIKSGATLVYLENDDTNKCFSVGFRTLPKDSTGVCHIIEHSLLCGSKKYPLKEPFVNLLKGSMATFLNALTAYDWTMYPVASQNDKDFDNLVSIYLDACFNPLSMVDEKPFLQEGWHLEMHNKNDIPAYTGVVYNEMKGAMSSVEAQLSQRTLEALYKGSCYEFNSGGDPDDIPNLTYQAYKDFYKEHYQPDNALFYLYGKMDIESKLGFLDKEYLSHYDKRKNLIEIAVPKPLINTDYRKEYEIGSDEELENNTYMSLSYALCTYDNALDLTGFSILVKALTSNNDSPLKKMLLDAKLGEDIDVVINDDNILPSLQVFLHKTNEKEKDRFRGVFLNSCQKLIDEGIDKQILLATINNLEFQNKEMDMGRMPKGLFFAYSLIQSYLYHVPFENYLEYTKYFDYYKKELNNGYFENLLKKYVIDSKHYAEVVLVPSKDLAKAKEEAMDKKMLSIKENMSEEDINKCLRMNEVLLEYQNKKDTKEELDTLPKLTLDDINDKVSTLPTEVNNDRNYEIIKHEFNTNKIAYLKLFFGLNVLSFDEVCYAKIISYILGNLDTTNYKVNDLQTLIKTYLGNISFDFLVSGTQKDECVTKLVINVSSLEENISYIPMVLNEILNNTIYDSEKILTILIQMKNALHSDIIENGTRLAMDSARSLVSKDGAINAKMSGLKMYRFLKEVIKNFKEDNILDKLKEVSSKLFNVNNFIVSVSGDKKTIDLLLDNIKKLKLDTKEVKVSLHIPEEESKYNALIIPSEVNYNAKAVNLKDLGVKPDGRLRVAQHIINFDYLWSEVRVKGGAYGCQLSIFNCDDVAFGSYRDPNVSKTYDAYDGVCNYLENIKISKEEFNSYLIGAVASFDQPASNNSRITLTDYNYLLGITDEKRRNRKKEMLNTTINDVKGFAPLFKHLAQMAPYYTIGNEAKIKKCKHIEKVDKLS